MFRATLKINEKFEVETKLKWKQKVKYTLIFF